MDAPFTPAIDSEGNVWIVNLDWEFTVGVSKFSSTGEALSPATQPGWSPPDVGQPSNLAIADNGTIWLFGYPGNSVYTHGQLLKLATNGTEIATYDGGYVQGNEVIDGSGSFAVDGRNNVWVASYETSNVAEFDTNGTLLSGTGYTGGGVQQFSDGIGIDNDGNVWVTGYNSLAMSKLSGVDGSALSPSSGWASNYGLSSPGYIAIDSAGSAWTSAYGGIVKFSSTGQELSDPHGTGAAFTGGGISNSSNESTGGVIDGDGSLWVMNTSTISEFANNGTARSSSSGYGSGALSNLSGLVTDGSGSIWATTGTLPEDGSTPSTNSTLVQFIGAAAPVVTPLSTAVKWRAVGARP